MTDALGRRRVLQALGAGVGAAALGGCSEQGSDGRVTASLWFSYGGKNREVLLELVQKFHAAQTRFRIHPTYQGDYFEALAKLRTAIAAHAAPTLTHVVGEVVPYLWEARVLEPLAEGLARAGEPLGLGSDLELVKPLAQEGTFTGGGERPLCALPFNRSTPIAYYHKGIFRELGLEAPRTWEELVAVARAATLREGGTVKRWGFQCPVDWWFWVAMVGQAGGEVVAPDGTPTLGGEAGVRALSLWQRLVHEERVMKPPPGRDYNAWQAANTDFLSGRTAMIWTSTAFLRYLEENAKFEVGAAPLPRDVRASVPTGGTFFVMPTGSAAEEREAGLSFLRWMMAPAQANEFATRTGYIPVNRAGIATLERDGYYGKHQNDRVALDQLQSASPWPWSTRLFRLQREAVQPRLEEAVLARRDAREVLELARKAALEP
ncbi:MAG: ABC transporter substrate-binding protein [Polyangiaceae bacterium]